MNKRCTNSSCRRTFSTLNAGGICPHCGKCYPQLKTKRKHPLPVRIELRVKTGKRDRYLYIQPDELFHHSLNGNKIKAVKAFRNQAAAQGYHIDIRSAKDFCLNLLDRRDVMTEWYLSDEEWRGLRYIKPVDKREPEETEEYSVTEG